MNAPLEVSRIDQTAFGKDKGNCQSACVAMMLGLSIEQVPNFYDLAGAVDEGHGQRWNEALDKFLNDHNVCRIAFKTYDGWRTALKGYYTVIGKSPRGDFLHVVIYKDGALWHDPHPSRASVVSEDEIEIYYPINPALKPAPCIMPMDDEVKFILGRPCFAIASFASVFRYFGIPIPQKAEDEQAYIAHWCLTLYAKHGKNWRDEGDKELDRMRSAKVKS